MVADFGELNQGKYVFTLEAAKQIEDMLKLDAVETAVAEIVTLAGGEDLAKGRDYAAKVVSFLRGMEKSPKTGMALTRIERNIVYYDTREAIAYYDNIAVNNNGSLGGSEKPLFEAVKDLTGIDENNNFTKGMLIPLAVRQEALRCQGNGLHMPKIADAFVAEVDKAMQKIHENAKIAIMSQKVNA
ncbi:MAG: hypothetical protein IKD08_03785 [Alphaproteobacteria bacterium]|nr:hypothetical protein [Alphaproteobacteria bacterium]